MSIPRRLTTGILPPKSATIGSPMMTYQSQLPALQKSNSELLNDLISRLSYLEMNMFASYVKAKTFNASGVEDYAVAIIDAADNMAKQAANEAAKSQQKATNTYAR